MFLLQGLSDIVFGKETSSIIQIPSGQLFYRNPTDTRKSRQLIFKDCSATIIRTNTSFNYQLVISRIFEEGEEELEDDGFGLDNSDQKTFLIDSILLFRQDVESESKDPNFMWSDIDSPSRICSWEFLIDTNKTNSTTITTFKETIYQCMFERKYRRSYNDSSPEELRAFVKNMQSITSKEPTIIDSGRGSPMILSTPKKSNNSRSNETLNDFSAMSIANTPNTPRINDNMSMCSTAVGSPILKTPAKTYIACESKGEVLTNLDAELYLYDPRFNQFVLHCESASISLLKMETFKYSYSIVVSHLGNIIISQIIDPRMTPTFNNEHHSFVWNWFNDITGEGPYSWSIKFSPLGDRQIEFRRTFSKCIYETLNQEDFAKVTQNDQDWITSAYQEDVEMEDAFEEENDQENDDDDDEEEIRKMRNESAADSDDENEFSRLNQEVEKNSHLTVGFKNDQSYVFRGNKVGIFSNADDELKFQTMISSVKDMNGNAFTPKKVMLHEQDSCMLMTDPKNDKHILKMDLTVGKVVEEWQVDDDVPVNEILPDSKYAQLTAQKTFIGINKNSLFRIDPRLGGNKRVLTESKQYQTKSNFSCAVTTGKGELAVASSKGDIRLYNKLNIRAKTHLPGLGDPIIGIDTTESGKWILATCKTYLLILNTEIKEKNQTGFTTGMGDKKPTPRRLQLRPEHVAWMGKDVNFTVAKFSTGQDEEKSIITSTGPFVITWNFRRVKSGKLSEYSIKKYGEDIVADNFKYGKDRSIIVALPSDVQMVNKSNLQTPTKMLKSKSNIVNSPY